MHINLKYIIKRTHKCMLRKNEQNILSSQECVMRFKEEMQIITFRWEKEKNHTDDTRHLRY